MKEKKENTTIYDIAKEAGVSVTTVTRAFKPNAVISVKTKERILQIAGQHHYIANRAAVSLSRNTVKIGIILLKDIFIFYSELIRGIQAAYAELSAFKVNYELQFVDKYDPSYGEHYLHILEEYRAGHCDGILLNAPNYSDSIVKKVEELIAQGIQVATLVSDIPTNKRVFASINNTEVAGKLAAELMTAYSKGTKTVIFSGERTSSIHQSLIHHFIEETEKEHSSEIVHIYDTKDSPDTADRMAVEALETYPDLSGIYISSANSLAICKRVVEYGRAKDITIIASDIFSALAEYIRKGVVNATIFQDPFHQAKTAFETLFFVLTEKIAVKPLLMTTPQIILKSNLCLYENPEMTQ